MQLAGFLFMLVSFSSCTREEVTNEAVYKKWRLIPPNKTKTIDQAIKEYYENRTRVVNIRVQLDYPKKWQHTIVDNLIDVLGKSTQLAYIVNVQNEHRESFELYEDNVFYVDSYEALMKVLPIFRGDRGNFAGRYMILLRLTHNRFQYIDEIQRILDTFFEIDIIDVNIVVLNLAGQLVLYSYDAFQAELCRDVTPQVANYFVDGHFVIPELFPQKLRNFNRCPIVFLSRIVPPFFYYSAEDQTNDTVSVHGVEAEMVKQIARHFNFTLDLKMVPQQVWGDVYENGTLTGPFQYLKNHSVDLLMGFFAYEERRMRRFGKSRPYILSPIIAVVNRKWEIVTISSTWLLDPFGKTTWLLIILTFCTAFALLSVTYTKFFRTFRCSDNRKYPTWLEAMGNALGLACALPDGGGRTMARLCILMWGVGFIICIAAYKGQLFVAYNHFDYSRTMTLDELRDANFTFLVRRTYNASQLLQGVLKVTPDRIVRVFTNNANDIYDHLTNYSGNVGTLATNLRIQYYLLERGYFDLLHTLPETLRLRQVCAYFRSHSYLIRPFNTLINRFMSSGLLSKWYSDAEFDLHKKHSRLMSQYIRDEPQPLDMSTFVPVFLSLIILLIFALLCFIGELGVHIWRKKKHRQKFIRAHHRWESSSQKKCIK